MLTTIMKQLNGHGGEAESLQAALLQLTRDRDAVRADIETLNQRRHQALLDDADDAAIDEVERLIDRANVRLEKLNISEAPLNEKLTSAKSAARTKAIHRHFDLVTASYEKLRTAMLRADAAQSAFMAARDLAIGEVGEHQVVRDIPIFAFGGPLGLGAAQFWAAENDRALDAVRTARSGKPAPTPATAPAPRTRPAKTTSLQHGVTSNPPPAQVMTAPRTPDDTAGLLPGETRVRVLRKGFSPADDRPQASAGQLLRMPSAAAHRAARAGAVEITESIEETKS